MVGNASLQHMKIPYVSELRTCKKNVSPKNSAACENRAFPRLGQNSSYWYGAAIPFSEQGVLLGMAVAFAEYQHKRRDLRRLSPL